MVKSRMYDVHAVGKRKTSVARVYMIEGQGKITVNKREIDDYFPRESSKYMVTQPLNLLNVIGKYDVVVNVDGGGLSSQAGAVRLGVSRALLKLNPAVRGELRKAGFLTRDSREVERKKYGVRGARRAFQFSKR
ncbi:MAG: 30S ribosomal protein S9 [Oligoflexia bacterium]|nr:30S ribosomal protein S9 [Oligoflexia bacterium]